MTIDMIGWLATANALFINKKGKQGVEVGERENVVAENNNSLAIIFLIIISGG